MIVIFLCVCVSVCLCVCVYVCMCVCVSVCLYVYMCACFCVFCVYVYMCVFVFVCVYVPQTSSTIYIRKQLHTAYIHIPTSFFTFSKKDFFHSGTHCLCLGFRV